MTRFVRGSCLALVGADMLHLNGLGLNIGHTILALLCAQALIAILVFLLELHVGRRSRTSKNGNPVLENITLREGPMSVRLGKLVRVEIFSGGLAAAGEEKMVRPKRRGIRYCNQTVDHHGPRDSPLRDCSSKRYVLSRHEDQDVCQTGANQEEGENGAEADKSKEVAIVSATNTVVEPHAVMVKGFDTIVADSTVIAARGSPNVTCLAELHRYIHGSHVRRGKLDHHPVICGWTKYQRIVCRFCMGHRVDIARHDLGSN
jgi:hypothetical protein